MEIFLLLRIICCQILGKDSQQIKNILFTAAVKVFNTDLAVPFLGFGQETVLSMDILI